MNVTSQRTWRLVAGFTAAGMVLATTACSSEEHAEPTSIVTPTTAASTTTAPPTSTLPPTTTPSTGGPRAASLENILTAHLAEGEFVGARIALLDGDGAISQATAGTTTIDPSSAPVDLDVPWNVGSVTKTFVAVVVLQLAEEGRIDLDEGIDGFVPDLPGADQITPRQLLQHTSGLGEYNNTPTVLNDEQREWTPSELIAIAEAAGRVGEPGGAFHYSNTNFVVLGQIIEQVTGRSWGDEVRTRIVEPLGMTGTSAMKDERPIGYQLIDGSLVDTSEHSPSTGGAAGALQSTPRDLLRFAAALADGTLLSSASQNAMQTFIPADDLSQFGIVHSYGLGLEQFALDSLTVDGHMGTGEAQSAFVGYDTEHHIAVAVMTNTAIAGPQAFMAVEALTDAIDAH